MIALGCSLRNPPVKNRPVNNQDGMALVMVLWLVAAMSLLVASVVYVARMDVQQLQFGQQQAKVGAIADKAMRLTMRQFVLDVADNGSLRHIAQQYDFRVQDTKVEVGIHSASGLVHLGSITPEFLLAVLQYGVGFDEQKIEALKLLLDKGFALAEVAEGELELPNRFRVIEDLLLIPGVSLDVFEKLKDYFYVGQLGAPGVNPAAAPRELLSVLAAGEDGVVEEFMSLRASARQSPGEEILPHSQFTPELMSSANSSVYRVDVTLSPSAKMTFKRRYWISLIPSRYGLSWTLQAKEPVQIVDIDSQSTLNSL